LHRNRYFFLTTRAGSGSGFGGEISGSGKKVRIFNTVLSVAELELQGVKTLSPEPE
jgi:hypothetical protein